MSAGASSMVPRSRVYRALRGLRKRMDNRERFLAFAIEHYGGRIELEGNEADGVVAILKATQRHRDKQRLRVFALEYYITDILKESEADMRQFVNGILREMKAQAKHNATNQKPNPGD
jgi:hypothetical protein